MPDKAHTNTTVVTDAERGELVALLLDACGDTFSQAGRTVSAAPDRGGRVEPHEAMAACIGFSGDGVRGALVFVAPASLFRDTYPVVGADLSDRDLADWAGEIANQLLGRLKNRLVARGLDFRLSMPAVLSGRELNTEGRNHPTSVNLDVNVGSQLAIMQLEIERDGGVAALAPNAPPSESFGEGEAMLF